MNEQWRAGRFLHRDCLGRWVHHGVVTIRPEDSLGAVTYREAKARGLDPRRCRVEVINL